MLLFVTHVVMIFLCLQVFLGLVYFRSRTFPVLFEHTTINGTSSYLWNDIRAIIQHVILWQIICNNTKSGIMKTGIIQIQP